MARVRIFASMRDAAGTGTDHIDGATLDDIVEAAIHRYGSDFAALLPTSTLWVNGEPADGATPIGDDDEVAFLPPVSGGC